MSTTFQKEEFSSDGVQWLFDGTIGPVFATTQGLAGVTPLLMASHLSRLKACACD